MFVQNATCWYTESVYNNDYRDVAFTEGSYLPPIIKKYREEGDGQFKLFLAKILECRAEVNSVSELCKKVKDLYFDQFGTNIKNAPLGFLVRPKMEGTLSSGNCSKYAKDHTNA